MARNNSRINVLRLETHPDCISSVSIPELIPELIAALLTPPDRRYTIRPCQTLSLACL